MTEVDTRALGRTLIDAFGKAWEKGKVDQIIEGFRDDAALLDDPFAEPVRHWDFGEGAPGVAEGRRAAGYIPATPKGQQMEIIGELVRLDHVNTIRERVKEWREAGYAGATGVTKELFADWFGAERERRPFFAQQEATERGLAGPVSADKSNFLVVG